MKIAEADIKVLKQYMDVSQNAVQSDEVEPDSATKRKLEKHAAMHKDVELNLRDEYALHLHVINKFKHFNSFKLYWDHAFYQIFVPTSIKQS